MKKYTLLKIIIKKAGIFFLALMLVVPPSFSSSIFDVNVAEAAPVTIVLNYRQTILTEGTQWVVPDDWTDGNNTIEVIGGGGAGRTDTAGTVGAGGGGGGGYSKITNLDLTPGATVDYQVGTGGRNGTNGGATFFNRTGGTAGTCADTVSVCANGGTAAASATGGAGGSTTGADGTTLWAGGAGGTGHTTSDSGGGGGGAGGPNAAGRVGGAGYTVATTGGGGGGGGNGGTNSSVGLPGTTIGGWGGNGDLGSGSGQGGSTASGGNATSSGAGGGGGDAGLHGGNGGDGTNLGGGVGPGGGGGGAGDTSTTAGVGGDGGLYGGGGGGGRYGGRGAPGVIIITYNGNTPTRSTWVVPDDWNDSDNTIITIGGGGSSFSALQGTGAKGGGGGAYSSATNVNLPAGDPITYAIGQGGRKTVVGVGVGVAGGDTYLCNSTSNCASIGGSAVVVGAKGGGAGTNGTTGGGAGGAAASGFPTSGGTRWSGGAGGNGHGTGDSGGGGGGAGGSSQDGRAGGAGATSLSIGGGGGGGAGDNSGTDSTAGEAGSTAATTGGDGGQGPAGTGGGAGGTGDGPSGTAGTGGGGAGAWQGNDGGSGGSGSATLYGGGGGGGVGDNNVVTNNTYNGGDGGLFGGGGGGGLSPGFGANGVIVITYEPLVVSIPTVTTDAESAVAHNSATLNGNITSTGNETGVGTEHGFAHSTNSSLSTGVSTSTLGNYSAIGVFSNGISSLDSNTTYYFRAYAVNSAGTSTGSIGDFLTLPGAPGTPSYDTTTATTTGISWSAHAQGATTYKLTRCVSVASCAIYSAISGTATTSYTMVGNTSYDFAIRGTNTTGDGPFSATSTRLTLPDVPGTPTFSNISSDEMRVSWTAPTGGSATYKVERCTGASCTDFSQIASGVSDLFYDDSGLTEETIYRYRIRGTNATGDGLYSGIGAQETAVASTQDPRIYSQQNQTFVIGQTTTDISPIIFEDGTTPTITAANNIRIAIASTTGFGMEWDTTDTSATISGSASGKVSGTVSYLGPTILLIDVTSDFTTLDSITISGLKYRNFTAPAKSGTGALRLYNTGNVTIAPTATSSDIVRITAPNVSGGTKGATISRPPSFLSQNSGLVGWWTFDGKDMVPNVRDISGQANHGNLSGQTSTSTIPAKLGQGLNFDGSDDYVGVSNNTPLQLTSDMTISLWARLKAIPTNGAGFVSVGISGETLETNILYQLSVDTASGNDIKIGHEYAGGTDQNNTFDTNLNIGDWYHILAARDNTAKTWTLYINGVPFSGGPYTFTNGAAGGTTGIFAIGRYASTNIYINADMDDVRIFGRALSATEARLLYNAGATKVSVTQTQQSTGIGSGLVGHWTFDGKNMYSNVKDSSSQSLNGNLSHGGSGTSTSLGKIGQALTFDGTNNYVSIGNAGSGIRTISFWIKTANPVSQKIINIDGTDQIETNGSSQITATSFPGATVYVNGVLGSTILAGEWNHVVVTDSTGVNASTLELGRVGSTYFGGTLDDVHIYSRILASGEITSLYKQGQVKIRP